jgi:hypothetical protein
MQGLLQLQLFAENMDTCFLSKAAVSWCFVDLDLLHEKLNTWRMQDDFVGIAGEFVEAADLLHVEAVDLLHELRNTWKRLKRLNSL